MNQDAVRICERDGLTSVMNNTKWRALLHALAEAPCLKRVKYIDSDSPSRWQGYAGGPVPDYVEFSGGPTPLVFIEWMDVQKHDAQYIGKLVSNQISDRSSLLLEILKSSRSVFEEHDTFFRIYGHIRGQATHKK